MNWGQVKDPVSQVRLAGAVVASWSPKHEVTGSNNLFTVILVKKFMEKSNKIVNNIFCLYHSFLIARIPNSPRPFSR